ncbi:MAG: hypothetical protein DRI87_01975 [Bacteroidetes bacterium]|nr:MAG: hypothetical protein DRI87_01975 [Bacteroidota bacterium]
MKRNKNIYLRAFELDDYKLLNKWRNNEEMHRLTCGNKYFISSVYDKKWVENKIFNKENDIYLAICLNENDQLIGYTSINEIDHRNFRAKWGGIMIEPDHNGKGVATEVGEIVIDYVFNELGFKSLHTNILEEHGASLRLVEKLGFKKEGLLRSSVFKMGKFHNEVILSLINE